MAKIGSGSSGLRSNKMIYGVIGILVVFVFVGALTLLKNIYQTETYYVLKQDVPTRTQVTPEMLEPVVTSKGTAPKAALSLGDVQSGYLFSKYPLIAGDILTDSNVGGFEDISVGVPDNWVVTSFSVNADKAVGGRIKRGVYFDILVTTNEGVYYPFVNVLALDTTVSMDNASSNKAADSEEAHAGQTSQYVVGMSPEDAARLKAIMKDSANGVELVLSPRQNEYNKPQLSEYNFKFDKEKLMETKNMGEGTDYTFTPVKRDTFGRPIEQIQNCSQGNAKIKPEDCKKASIANQENNPSASPTHK